MPISGIWSINYGIASVSCPDTGTFSVDPEIQTAHVNLSIQDGGASLVFGPDRFTLVGAGVYVGQTTAQIDGQTLTYNLSFRVIGPRRVEGTSTFSFDGCTAVMPIIFTVDG